MAKRSDLIEAVRAKHPDIPAEDVANAIGIIFEYISEQLKAGNRVEIRGFGSFSIRQRKMSAGSASAQYGKGNAEGKVVNTIYYRMSSGATLKE